MKCSRLRAQGVSALLKRRNGRPAPEKLNERSVTSSMEDRGGQVQDQLSDQALGLRRAANGQGRRAGGRDAAAGSAEPQSLMQQLLSDPSHDYRALKYGDVIDGTVMQRDRDEFLVDIGSKSEGIIPSKEYSTLTSERSRASRSAIRCWSSSCSPRIRTATPSSRSTRRGRRRAGGSCRSSTTRTRSSQAQVTNYNKGGLLVNLDGVRGFVPASQVTEIRGGDDASSRPIWPGWSARHLPLKVIEINRHRNRLILSERMAVQERRDAMKERLIENLKEGETRKGRVSSIADFGAFVDIGGADGLVHLSEISWSRVSTRARC